MVSIETSSPTLVLPHPGAAPPLFLSHYVRLSKGHLVGQPPPASFPRSAVPHLEAPAQDLRNNVSLCSPEGDGNTPFTQQE
ncbi:unnamed protein product [Lota lota]